MPAGTPNARAAADAAHDIRAVLTGAGVPSRAIETRGYRPRDPGLLATVRLNYPKMTAQAGPCGLWPDDLGPTLDARYNQNEPYWNLGCANQRNLAAMVDNPDRPGAAARGDADLCGTPFHRARKVPQGRELSDHVSGCRQGHHQRRWQMIKFALQNAEAQPDPVEGGRRADHIAPVPRISIQAFCESAETAAVMQAAAEDRRMIKAHLKLQMGGVAAAAEAYRSSPTPNVIVIESESRGAELLAGLDPLSEVCDPGTRVVVIGRVNDILFYRELVRRQISDYLIAPIGVIDIIRAISGMFSAPDAKPVGRTIAVVGAKGGVGASTVAHNIAWAIARDLKLDAVVTDLDLPFGTAGLDYNQDPPQGIADAVFSPERIDTGVRRPAAVEVHRSLEPAGGARHARAGLRFRRRGVRRHLRRAARNGAVHRARRAACVDGLVEARPGRRRRHPDRGRARSRQPAQRQEPDGPVAPGASERPAGRTTA